jgi:hypothetical protein
MSEREELRADLANVKGPTTGCALWTSASPRRSDSKSPGLDPGSARPDELHCELQDARAELCELSESLTRRTRRARCGLPDQPRAAGDRRRPQDAESRNEM